MRKFLMWFPVAMFAACVRSQTVAVNADLVPDLPTVQTTATAPVDTAAAIGPLGYPPTAVELFVPPLPMPGSVKGFHMEAEFEVDPFGKATLLAMSRTPDARYNRRLQDELKKTRWRPGTTASGQPARAKARIVYVF